MSRLLSQRRQRGVTLTELMIALVLGALVVLAATSAVVTSRGTYRNQDESTRIAESSRFGLELVNRMVRLAGYTNYGDDPAIPAFYTPDASWVTSNAYALNGPNIAGANNSKPTSPTSGYNSSDSIVIRYYGASNGTPGPTPQPADGNVLDCAGIGVPVPTGDAVAYTTSRAYNVLFVDTDVDGEPSLKCQRQTYDATTGAPTGVNTQTLIRGVEDFQVLYGEAVYGAGDDPDAVAPLFVVYHQGIGGSNPVVNWDNVVTVRIAMLLRSSVGAQVDTAAKTYHLFGDSSYPNEGSDAGSLFSTAALSVSERSRVRRVVQTTVFVRNRISPWSQLQGIN